MPAGTGESSCVAHVCGEKKSRVIGLPEGSSKQPVRRDGRGIDVGDEGGSVTLAAGPSSVPTARPLADGFFCDSPSSWWSPVVRSAAAAASRLALGVMAANSAGGLGKK